MTTLSRRALNRATLARQLLLQRSDMPVLDAVEHLAGLQAQTVRSWYLGLWTRLNDFDPEELSKLLEERQVVRMALMRSTIHLVSSKDALWMRPLVAAPIERTTMGAFGKHLGDVDREALEEQARNLLEQAPLTFTELGEQLRETWPQSTTQALAQAARMWLPLVQTPPRGTWHKTGLAKHTTMEKWLNEKPFQESRERLVARYLQAFGPATVKDAQTWSGVTRLKPIFEQMNLTRFRDEQGRELFDLPDAPRPDPDTPAPPRLLYDFDNLLLSHADRSRVVADDYNPLPLLKRNEQPNTVLIDGYTKGIWKIHQSSGETTLRIRTFGRLRKQDADQLRHEATELLTLLHSQQRGRVELTLA